MKNLRRITKFATIYSLGSLILLSCAQDVRDRRDGRDSFDGFYGRN